MANLTNNNKLIDVINSKQNINLSAPVTIHGSQVTTVEGAINALIDNGTIYHFQGSVATKTALPATANAGDVYNVIDTGRNYAWTGTEWDDLGGTFEISDYYTKTEINTILGDDAYDETTSTWNKIFASSDAYSTTTVNECGSGASAINYVTIDAGSVEDDKTTVHSATEAVNNAVKNIKTIRQQVNANSEAIAELQCSNAATDEVKRVDVVFANTDTVTVSDAFVTAATAVDTWVVKSGTEESRAFEFTTEAGKLNVRASNVETALTIRVRLIKEVA